VSSGGGGGGEVTTTERLRLRRSGKSPSAKTTSSVSGNAKARVSLR
jgi:hypothetical protein